MQPISLNVSVKSVSCVREHGDVDWLDVGCVDAGGCSENIEGKT